MSRNLAAVLAVLLCVVVAGVGGYLAMKPAAPAAPAASVPAPGAKVPQDLAQITASPAASAATGTENVINDPPASPAASTSTPAPASAPAHARSKGNAGKAGSTSGTPATGAAVPASEPAAQGAGWSGVEKPWPSGNATTATSTPPDAAPPVVEPLAPPPPPPGPPPKVFEELVISADSVLGLQLDSTVSSEVARVEDPVNAHVTREVKVGADVAVPAGTRVLGSVTQVDRGGKMKSAARVGVKFHTLVMADGTRLPINTEAILREGRSPGQESAAKVGAAAVGGAILGAIIGGGKGAAIGGAVGGAGGTAAMMAGGRNPAVLSSGTAVTVRLQQPVTVTIERVPQ
jgi:hypothetical protein